MKIDSFEIKMALYRDPIANKILFDINSDYNLPLLTDNEDLVIERIKELIRIGGKILL